MSAKILSNSLKVIDKAIKERSANEEDRLIAEFMCFILGIEYRNNDFIFEIIKAEYTKQTKIINKIILNAQKKDEIDIIKIFVQNKSDISPFIFAYSERNI